MTKTRDNQNKVYINHSHTHTHSHLLTQYATTRSIAGKADTDIRFRRWYLIAEAKPTPLSIDRKGSSKHDMQ